MKKKHLYPLDLNFILFYPTKSDPRWLVLTFILCYVIFALSFSGFSRGFDQFFASVLTCLLFDIVFLFFKRTSILPLSSLVSSLGLFLLCDSNLVWIYSLIAAISISSKHLIRISHRHIFNPNNFGIVFGVLFFPNYMTTVAGRWGGSLLSSALIGILGVAVVIRVRRLPLVISYAITFFAGALARALLLNRPFFTVAAPITGAAFQLYLFYMLTDPVTTPKGYKNQAIFGVGLGFLDACFRFYQVKYAPFFSLFLMCAAFSFIEEVCRTVERDRPWMIEKFSFRGLSHEFEA